MLSSYLQHYNADAPRLSTGNRLWLGTMMLIGASIRVYYQYDREFTGDEVGTVLFAQESLSYLLSHYEGWLTMNYYIALEKAFLNVFGPHPYSLGFVSLVAGIITIPLTAYLALRLTTVRVSLIAAGLVAINPYLVGYSGTIRSYSLLAALSLTVIILFIRWHSRPTLQNGIWLSVACFFVVLCHLNGVYVVAFVTILVALRFLSDRTKAHAATIVRTLLLPLLICGLCFGASHVAIFPHMAAFRLRWVDAAPTSVAYLPHVWAEYFGESYWGVLSLGLLCVGLWSAWRRQEFVLLLILCPSVPIVLMSLEGFSHFPWAYGRFLIYSLPLLIIFVSKGLDSVVTWFVPWQGRVWGVVLLCAVVAATWWPAMESKFHEKRTMAGSAVKKAAAIIAKHYAPNDVILMTNWFSEMHLPLYLSKEYVIVNIGRFLLGREEPTANEKVFVVSSCSIRTGVPQYATDGGTVAVYPFRSRMEVLEQINDDMAECAEREGPGTVDSEIYRVLCRIGMRLRRAESRRYCELWKEYGKENAVPWDTALKMKSLFSVRDREAPRRGRRGGRGGVASKVRSATVDRQAGGTGTAR